MTTMTDHLPFSTPSYATQGEEDAAMAMIRDGALVPVSTYGTGVDGFVSPAFIEVCADAAMEAARAEAAHRDECADLERERDDLLRDIDMAAAMIRNARLGVVDVDATLTEALATLEGKK